MFRFHALSYIAKHNDPATVQKISTDIQNTQFNKDGQFREKELFLNCYKRGLDRLLKRNGDRYRDHQHLHRLTELINDVNNSLRQALEPREPFSIICHGDFNRNNMMFRYDQHSSIPVDTLLFDFGTPRYGSPALDLSFFLYLNTAQEMRENRWDDLLDTYCKTLAATVPSHIHVPDRSDLDTEMASNSLFGFAHALLFQPVQIQNGLGKINRSTLPPEEYGLIVGGEVATEYLADIIQHFVDMGYIKV